MQLAEREAQILDGDFLSILQCPVCHVGLTLESDHLRCGSCMRAYPVEDGIPILIAESDESAKQLRHQRRFFDEEFAVLEHYNLLNWHKSYLNRIFAAAGVSSSNSGRFLDIGSGGTAYTVIEAARLGWYAVGCDLSIRGVRNAIKFSRHEGVEHRAKFVVCSAEALPFKSQSFNAVSCIAVLEHLVRDDLAAAEIGRVCAPHGTFFATVPNSWLRTNLLFWLPSWLNDRRHKHLRHYSSKTLAALFKPRFDDLSAAHTARTVKGIQLLLARLRIASERIWWWLERIDLTNPQSPWGAQLHMSGRRRQGDVGVNER